MGKKEDTGNLLETMETDKNTLPHTSKAKPELFTKQQHQLLKSA